MNLWIPPSKNRFIIIVPFYYSYHLTDKFVDSIFKEKHSLFDLVIVDNSETILEDRLVYWDQWKIDYFNKNFPNYENELIRPRIINICPTTNLQYSKTINQVIEWDYIKNKDIPFLIFNPDCFPEEENWLTNMYNIWKQLDKPATLGTLQYDDNNIWHFGTMWKDESDIKCHELDWKHINSYNNQEYIKCDGNTGTGIMVDSNKFIELGMFNSNRYPMYSSDADYCKRATEKGYNHYCCNIIMNHKPGSSTKK
jgi:GT2 family glycosyltransferase